MSTIIMRSAIVAWGGNPSPDTHSIVIDHRGRHVVTWSEIMEHRRQRQAEILRYKRSCYQWRAFKVWVAYFDQFLFGGWQAFIENKDGCRWIDRDRPFLKRHLMDLFPLVFQHGDEDDQWHEWKVEFAKRFRRRTHHRRPLGVAYVWWDQHHAPRLKLGGA